ncbi:hypothetical protein N8I77_012074 [Diaporthe amygdali]|uniref:Uncharacterized protein n=1 Tax=Phomopsis amygdali TaxID=1214568 RepID=A0AAD9VY17_PHOAM|nr:hypothetical protein N8I77_012074 [Diaporthe amygdali]KAK2598681.1 hypothetical protein N8I77_012074 [Diaporthe amygdali]
MSVALRDLLRVWRDLRLRRNAALCSFTVRGLRRGFCRRLGCGLGRGFGFLSSGRYDTLGQLALDTLTQADLVDPALDALVAKVLALVQPPPTAAGVDSQNLDVSRQFEGLEDVLRVHVIGVHLVHGEQVALALGMLVGQLCKRSKCLFSWLAAALLGHEGQYAGVRLGTEAVRDQLLG